MSKRIGSLPMNAVICCHGCAPDMLPIGFEGNGQGRIVGASAVQTGRHHGGARWRRLPVVEDELGTFAPVEISRHGGCDVRRLE